MTRITVVHTAQLVPRDHAAARTLLFESFAGDFDEHDWDHCLGGLHVLAWDGELVGHGALVQRRLYHHGRSLRAGYIEGVAVLADRRRTGVGSLVMTELERLVRDAYQVGALSAAHDAVPLYARRGWVRWRGQTGAMTPGGIMATPEDDDGVFVLPLHAPLDIGGQLICDWRDGDLW